MKPFFNSLVTLVTLAGFHFTTAEHGISKSLSSNSTSCRYPTLWMTQPVDHHGGHNGTFQQRYRITTEFYKTGGPILLFQGEESTELDCLESTVMFNFAQELNGIAVALEHRYFGKSVPFGSDLAAYTPEQYSYLTLDNVMDDAVQFINAVQKNVTGAEDAPVFAASGSYGAFLMTLFRQNRPKTFDGVIASAPALVAFYGGNDTNVAGQYNWWNYVSTVYRQRSSQAANKIKNAFDTLRDRFARNDTQKLQHELNLCSPLESNSSDTFSTLATFLYQPFGHAPEFNYKVARPGRTPFALPFDKFIDIAVKEEVPLQILNRTNYLWNSASAASADLEYSCLNISDFHQIIVLAAPLISTVPFEYITCTYLSFDADSIDSPNSLFPTNDSPARSHPSNTQDCQTRYGVSAPPASELYSRYHFTEAEIQASTGIIISLAEFDPTTSVSGAYTYAMPARADPYASRRLFTSGMAHREDLWAWDEHTREQVRATNMEELEILKEWIAIVKAKKTAAP